MGNNKLLGALLVLVVASGLYWIDQYRQISDRFSVLKESFSYNTETVVDEISDEIQVGFSESEASQCFYVDLSIVNRTLKRGSQGEDVKVVQAFLADEYALNPDDITTGYFGSLTERWIKELQFDKDIDQTGVVDDKTLDAMEEEQVASCAQ